MFVFSIITFRYEVVIKGDRSEPMCEINHYRSNLSSSHNTTDSDIFFFANLQ
jgi:hypothetical protein